MPTLKCLAVLVYENDEVASAVASGRYLLESCFERLCKYCSYSLSDEFVITHYQLYIC